MESRRVLAQVSGSIAADATWTLANSPYEVTGDVTVQNNATLTIDPGVIVRLRANTGITVRGRIIAEGNPEAHIRMERAVSGSAWDGLTFTSTLQDNRLTFVDMAGGDGQGNAITVTSSRLTLDNVTWTGTTHTILELNHPSVIVRDSEFPRSSGDEIVHGEHLSGDEYLIFDGNVFANSNNGSDVIDFTGADRPGPVMQVLNNTFLGGGDDGLDLDGTDAHVEGNVFMNFHRNTSRATTSNAIATGLPQSGESFRTQLTVIRNIFVNNDHAMLLKEDAFADVQQNLFLNSTIAAVQFNEVGGTAVLGVGKGASFDGNIFFNNAQLFKNLINQPTFKTQLTVNRSLLPNDTVDFGGTPVAAHSLGTGNLAGDPLFVDAANGNYRLQPTSPAVGAGPLGLDIGAMVPAGPVLRARGPVSSDGAVTIDVGGPGISQYRYRMANGSYSPLTAVATPISLTGLAEGSHTVEVIGMNDAGEWMTGQSTNWGQRTFDVISPRRVRTNELLPIIARAENWTGATDATWNGLRDLANSNDLAQRSLRFKRGVATLSPVVTATQDFVLSVTNAAASPVRSVQILPNDFPVEEVGGTLSGDIHWTADREYRVTSNLTIPAGSRLTIDAGTRVLLGNRINMRINGELHVEGTAADPTVFQAIDPTKPWGGLEFANGTSELRYVFLTNGGADTSRTFGHSNSQPMIRATNATVQCTQCFLIFDTGKGFGTTNRRIDIMDSILSNVDTGAQFDDSVVHVDNTWLVDISNNGRTFVDDDNDGFYFHGVHSSGEASRFRNSVIVNTKDDGLDHNGAKLEVISSWIEGTFHEGLATSEANTATVIDSVFQGSNQGVEAGYGSPKVTVEKSVIVRSRSQIDPNSPINAGLRFGDGYDGSIAPYTGHITAKYLVLFDNGDNVRNYDGSIPGPKPGAINITSSLTNDPDATDPSNINGTPVFSRTMHLLRGSAGFAAGPDGLPLGRIIGPTSLTIERSSVVVGDFNGDGVLNAADINRLCVELRAATPDVRFDLTGDGIVNDADYNNLVIDRLHSNFGDANLDGIFNSTDLVQVFAQGKYEDGIAENAGWEDGVWVCVGVFGTAHLVQAFQSGGYVAAAIPTDARALLADDIAAAILDADESNDDWWN